MGIIYLITSPSGKQYVGQTIQPLNKRWKQHIDASKRLYKDHCKILNKALRKYGENFFKIEVLEICDDELLDIKEIEYINKFNTLIPNGMNIKKGGSNGQHHEITKIKISNSLKGRKVDFNTKLKLSQTTNPSLPMYMIKISNGYRVCNHPMGPEKRFISRSQTDDVKYDRALKYLDYLNDLNEPIIIQKRSNEKYIQKYNHGYCVKYPNEKYKYFVSKQLPNESLYDLAIKYLNILKSKNAVQRLNGSGNEC